MINFCDRVDPFVENEEIFWKAEKQIIRNGKRITAYEIGETPTKAKVKLYNLLTALLFCFFGFAQQNTDCWYIYKKKQTVDIMKNDKAHAIKPESDITANYISPGTHMIVFLDQDKAPSTLTIYNCNQPTILNIYNGQGKVKTYGDCQKNHITL